MTQTVHDK